MGWVLVLYENIQDLQGLQGIEYYDCGIVVDKWLLRQVLQHIIWLPTSNIKNSPIIMIIRGWCNLFYATVPRGLVSFHWKWLDLVWFAIVLQYSFKAVYSTLGLQPSWRGKRALTQETWLTMTNLINIQIPHIINATYKEAK
jgi:hypothetical protein